MSRIKAKHQHTKVGHQFQCNKCEKLFDMQVDTSKAVPIRNATTSANFVTRLFHISPSWHVIWRYITMILQVLRLFIRQLILQVPHLLIRRGMLEVLHSFIRQVMTASSSFDQLYSEVLSSSVDTQSDTLNSSFVQSWSNAARSSFDNSLSYAESPLVVQPSCASFIQSWMRRVPQ